MKLTARHTVRAAYVGYLTQAITINFAPLLFVTFGETYDISLGKIGLLIGVSFLTQLIADAVSAKVSGKINTRGTVIFAHLCAVIGMTGFAYLPDLMPDPYIGLMLSTIIAAIGGKARRITVIMPMLYEGRQHKRTTRESLDCAIMLQELTKMGVSNIITFDAHDPRVANAIPLSGFDNVMPNYQMIKALVKNVPDIIIDKDHVVMISPDEGAMGRCIAYSNCLSVDVGMFYKRRDYSTIVNGKNPILEHKYLGQDLEGKDVIIVDDMISSGGSLLDVATQLKNVYGAKRVFNFATFGLFTDGFDAFDEAYEKGIIDKIFTTNLVYRKPEIMTKPWYVEVNMCKYVSYIIDTLNHDTTISNLLDPNARIANLLAKHRAELGEHGQMAMDFNK